MPKPDRRTQRTRDALQQALIALMQERSYDTITIQDITERANVGRTTLYLHYADKDALLLSCHEVIVQAVHRGPRYPATREALLAPEPPPGLVSAYEHLTAMRAVVYPLFQSADGGLLLRRLRDWLAHDIHTTIQAAFPEHVPTLPLDLLATALAGAQLSLAQWWVEQRRAESPATVAL
ncbi:MAG TPA: TetR/AcrR family transcriptional regulator, partial [Herpetosiphonaceae bacterium]